MCMKEIGGYLELETFPNKELYGDLIAVNSARNALLYILKARKIKKLYIPYFLCDTVSGVCNREGYAYEYYNIDKNFCPVFNKRLKNDEFIYVVNYYGQLDNSKLLELKEIHKNIICDNVQAFFQSPVKDVDTVYSCRKFFGVPDGGYVATDCLLDIPLKTDISMDRMKHVLGRYEGNSATEYYGDFKSNDSSFANLELRAMSKLTHNIMGAVDYEKIRLKREENFKNLHSMIGSKNKLSLSPPIGPYAYPFYCSNGLVIRKKLAENKIFVPTLWPEVVETDQTLEKDYAANILPLPCDQRYGFEDMIRIFEEINSCVF